MSSKELKATYGMIEGYKSRRSTKWLALSEFIDNSIASWIENKEDKSDVNGLEIKIIFDETDKENIKIDIYDNANAMDEEKLVNAMQPCDTNGKSDTQYNQYGEGMKFGIFWYGATGIVYSKKENQDEYFVELKITSENLNQSVKVESIKSTENKIPTSKGTLVRIQNIYDNRRLVSKELEEIESALGWRYRKLLLDENGRKPGMKITLKKINTDEKSKNKSERLIKPYFTKPFSAENFIDYLKSRNSNFKNFENGFTSSVENLIFNHNSHSKILEEFCYKLINWEKLVSKIEVNFKINGEIKSTFLEFGIINSGTNLSKNDGVTTFHLGRAINHGPNNINNSENRCLRFRGETSEGSVGDPTWRRLFGEIDLTGIQKPDQNKSRFDWSYGGLSHLYDVLKNIWSELKPLLHLIISWEKKYVDVNLADDKESLIKISNSSKETLNSAVVESSFNYCEETEKEQVVYYVRDEKLWVYVIEKKDGDLVEIIEKEVSESEKEWYVYFNANHPFLKPIIEKLEIRGKTIYPIILLLALCHKHFDDRNFFGNVLPDVETIRDFKDVINRVVKVIESNNEK